MAGAETGVELADKLSSHLGLRTNGTSKSEARRNKYIMGETIRAAGIRAVKQLRASTWGEIMEFLDEWRPSPFQVVLKPISSAGSDDVILCQSVQGVQEAFGRIIGKINALGLVNSAVLVQEYLDGPEFVVDMVSRDGEHKVVAIWEYDWRPANNSTFVCHGCRLLSLEDQANCPADLNHLIAYQKRVCSALGILNGPSHGEIIWSVAEHRPILVEVNATIDAYLSPERFNALPDK
ncbi:ddaF, partial [Symbiodinium microadriaticum]